MTRPWTPHRAISAASDNATLVRAGRTRLGLISINNINAAARYLHLFDKATAPTTGTDTPKITIPLAGASAVSIALDEGMMFELGLGYTITTTIAAGAGNVSANEHVVSLGYAGIS